MVYETVAGSEEVPSPAHRSADRAEQEQHGPDHQQDDADRPEDRNFEQKSADEQDDAQGNHGISKFSVAQVTVAVARVLPAREPCRVEFSEFDAARSARFSRRRISSSTARSYFASAFSARCCARVAARWRSEEH